MSEIEVPIEQVQEEIHHAAHVSSERWVGQLAVSSAILAAFAAVCALLAGFHSNEAMLAQIRASDTWSHYQAKGIKAAISGSLSKNSEKAADYRKEQRDLSDEARALEAESRVHMKMHERLAAAVTLFQISIAMGAIAALTRRRWFWRLSLGLGASGAALMAATWIGKLSG